MNSFEINKIITAILVTILVVFGIGKISNIIFDKEDKNIVAYKVEAPEGSAVKASTEASVDISTLLALGDVEHGKKVFKKCAACHSINAGGGNKIGPKLWNVMFRPVGAITEYKYSKALSFSLLSPANPILFPLIHVAGLIKKPFISSQFHSLPYEDKAFEYL